VSTKRTDPAGAQPTDPPWARLLFLLVQSPDGQCWRAILLVTPFLLLMTGLVMVTAVAAPVNWVGGALGLGSLTALAASRRRIRGASEPLRIARSESTRAARHCGTRAAVRPVQRPSGPVPEKGRRAAARSTPRRGAGRTVS
jgi:hypothetical protein